VFLCFLCGVTNEIQRGRVKVTLAPVARSDAALWAGLRARHGAAAPSVVPAPPLLGGERAAPNARGEVLRGAATAAYVTRHAAGGGAVRVYEKATKVKAAKSFQRTQSDHFPAHSRCPSAPCAQITMGR
jgi:hypothetical protein